MINILLRVAFIVVGALFASGVWVRRLRRRLLSERDYAKAERWSEGARDQGKADDPLLARLDVALRHDSALDGATLGEGLPQQSPKE
jgi:hypothetical protein